MCFCFIVTNHPLSTTIECATLTSIETAKKQGKSYGIKFSQSNKVITFEGTIRESEWTYRFMGTHLCAKLKTIYIWEERNSKPKKFMGFQQDNYLLSTEDQYINQVQGEPVCICVDQQNNPGFLKIRKRLYLQNQNHIHELQADDFEFCQDKNIKVKKLIKAPKQLHDNRTVPSIRLELSNSTGKLRYQKCDICFNQKGIWTIKAEAKWVNIGNNAWRAYLSNFTAVPGNIQVDGVIYNDTTGQFLILVPPVDNQEQATRIEIYTESAVNPGTLEFFAKKNVSHLHCIPFHKKYFRFKQNPDKVVTKINYHYKDHPFKPRPTIFITTETQKINFIASTARSSAKKSISDIWDQIDEKQFDSDEYETRHEIYNKNIQHQFFCTLQAFSYNHTNRNYLNTSAWRNSFSRIPVIENDDPFKTSYYIKVVSEHKTNKYTKEYYTIKSDSRPLGLIEAIHKLKHFNTIKFARQDKWRMPTITELTQIFQYKQYQESCSNLLNHMISHRPGEKIQFWTSTFQNREKKILWTIRISFKDQYHENSFSKMDYTLAYYSINSNKKAYLLPITEP